MISPGIGSKTEQYFTIRFFSHNAQNRLKPTPAVHFLHFLYID